MAVGYSPKIILDGLSLTLDAGVPTSWNVGISTNWTDKVGGNNGTLVGGTYHNDGPFVGAGYVEFDGTDDHLSISDSDDLDLSTGDFTIEFWVYAHSLTNFDGIVGKRDPSNFNNNSWRISYGSGNSSINLAHTSSNSVSVSYAPAPSLNTWTHYAFARESGTMRAFKNGVKETDVSSYTHDFSNTYSLLIAANASSSYTWDGYISNVRVVKGTALYTSNFTPPAEPLTAVTNTTLLTCQGNAIVDASSSAHTITANGGISLTKEPFGGAGAVEFDGTGDELNFTSIDVGTGDFTYEAWVYPTVSTVDTPIIVWHNGTSKVHTFGIWNGSAIDAIFSANARPGASNSWIVSSAISVNTWHHIAFVRASGTLKLYVDGTEQSTSAGSGSAGGDPSSYSTDVSYVGSSAVNENFVGKISNARVISGTALYTSNFTPPSRTLEPIENTVLLTCQGQNIKDASSNSHAITVNGDAKATIVSSSFEFDGTNDYVQVPNSSALQLGTGDFTIEMWWYMIGSGNCRGFTLGDAYDANGMELYLGSSGTSLNVYIENATRITADSVPSFGTWHHYAIERTSGTMKLYIDGVVQSGTYSSSQSLGTGTDGDLRIGVEYYNGGLSFVGDCKISNFKIYKGKGFTATEVLQNYNALKGRYA